MKKVMVFGTFDIFHKGHESYLKQAKSYGQFLIAIVARDKNVLKIKGRSPVNSEKKRKAVVMKSGLASQVLLGSLKDMFAAIKKYSPDVICLGYDQFVREASLTESLKDLDLGGTKVIRLKPYKPDIYKSSKLNNK